jgi:tripartite-type tricarboxylate transporter receptor subunit TctC
VPTGAEAGFPGYEVAVWWGIAGPRGLPRPVFDRLRKEFTAILGDPETEKVLARDAAQVKIIAPTEFRKYIHEEVVKWTRVAKEADIKVQ